jgi:hypothetical protein
MLAPRRSVRTYELHGQERYRDTGRPVDEELGSHVVLWIVDDPEAWARAVEAEGDAQVGLWPKSRLALALYRRNEKYRSAAQIREEGAGRRIYGHYLTAEAAEGCRRDLERSHPNPGVRYEVAAITQAGACGTCHQPTIVAAGETWHHLGRYPIECSGPSDGETDEDVEPEPPGRWEPGTQVKWPSPVRPVGSSDGQVERH